MLPAKLDRFPNGLRLVTIPDGNAESVTFSVFVQSGSRHERPRQAGISHFIEHMLFKGTANRTAREINRAIECRGGSFNAYTSQDGTVFYAKLPCEFLPVAVDVICDMYANAAFPEKEFERERNVVLQELKMYEDDPGAVASENFTRCIFPGNALGSPVGGTEKTLRAFSADDLRRHFRRAYVPAATVVAVTGRFDPEDVIALVSETLAKAKKGRPVKFERFDARTKVVPECVVERDVHQTQTTLGWRLPFGVYDGRRYALGVMNTLMGGGMSSRLFETVRERRGLSYDIASQMELFDETGYWAVSGGTDPARADEMRDVVMREVERIRTKKVGPAELRRVKDYINGRFRIAFEQPLTRLIYYAGSVFQHDRIVKPESKVKMIESVTSDEIIAVANECLVPGRMAVSRVVPK